MTDKNDGHASSTIAVAPPLDMRDFIRKLRTEITIEKAALLKATPGLSTALHLHPALMHVAYAIQGRGRCTVESHNFNLAPGDLHFVFPNEIHQYVADTRYPYHIYFIHLRWFGAIPSQLPRYLHTRRNNPLLEQWFGELVRLTTAPCKRPLMECHTLRKDAVLRLIFAEILETVFRSGQSAVQQFHPACPNRHFADLLRSLQTPPFRFPGLDRMAQTMGMSRTAFTVFFRKATGFSPRAYFNRSRMLYAEQLVDMQDIGIKEIAYQCGYANSQNCTRAIKWHRAHRSKR